MSAWSNLPNAAHIDRVLTHAKAHHDKWAASRDAAWDAFSAASRDASRAAAYEAAWDEVYGAAYDADYGASMAAAWAAAYEAAWRAAMDASREASRGAAYEAAWRAAMDASREASRGAVWRAAMAAARAAVWDACVALIAWDKAGDLVGKNPQQLIALSAEGVHAATLLLPASIAMAETGGASVSLDEVEATTMQAEQIRTWAERCEEHPDHEGIVTHAMIQQRMQEEIDDLRALLSRFVLCEKEPVAWKYTLEYGNFIADTMLSRQQLRYPFGVCGADYARQTDNGISYVRESPLYAPAALNADMGKEGNE